MGLLSAKVAIVTGAANEIAQGIALRFCREGAIVIVVDPDSAQAEALASRIGVAGGEARAYGADLGQPGEAERLAGDIVTFQGGIDILVNASHPPLRWDRLDHDPLHRFRSAFEATVAPAVAAMAAVRPHMVRRGGGRIINVGSVYGASANEGVADAVTMDGALAALSRAAGVEWARDNVLINFLQGAVPDTAMFAAYRAEKGVIVDHLIEIMPMRRLAVPIEDIGGAALLLASDEGCFLVGQKVYADGGQHLVAAVFEPGATR
ncbi:MAG: hypothetical protein JWO25_2601 [Alphaproteobacteria bacterium]|nr:hypothetical protein [Alphaproteobacteria bacterium]